jgi:hypothetical protein
MQMVAASILVLPVFLFLKDVLGMSVWLALLLAVTILAGFLLYSLYKLTHL